MLLFTWLSSSSVILHFFLTVYHHLRAFIIIIGKFDELRFLAGTGANTLSRLIYAFIWIKIAVFSLLLLHGHFCYDDIESDSLLPVVSSVPKASPRPGLYSSCLQVCENINVNTLWLCFHRHASIAMWNEGESYCWQTHLCVSSCVACWEIRSLHTWDGRVPLPSYLSILRILK